MTLPKTKISSLEQLIQKEDLSEVLHISDCCLEFCQLTSGVKIFLFVHTDFIDYIQELSRHFNVNWNDLSNSLNSLSKCGVHCLEKLIEDKPIFGYRVLQISQVLDNLDVPYVLSFASDERKEYYLWVSFRFKERMYKRVIIGNQKVVNNVIFKAFLEKVYKDDLTNSGLKEYLKYLQENTISFTEDYNMEIDQFFCEEAIEHAKQKIIKNHILL